MEWFGRLTDGNAWYRGAFEGSMLAIFIYLAQFRNNWVWIAVLLTLCVMAGEFKARRKMHSQRQKKDLAVLRKLEKRCDELEQNVHRWKAQALKLQTKIERSGLDL
jgi:hypothetical protein